MNGLFGGLAGFILGTLIKGKETLTNVALSLFGSTIVGLIADIILPILTAVFSGQAISASVDLLSLVITNFTYGLTGFISGELLMEIKAYIFK